jgi:hypothetical protein
MIKQTSAGIVSTKVTSPPEAVVKSTFSNKLNIAPAMIIGATLFVGGDSGFVALAQEKQPSQPLVQPQMPGAEKPRKPGAIPPDQFDKLHKMIKPQRGESRFMEIPWVLSVWEGRQKAAVEGKPMLVWAGGWGTPIGVC